MTKVAIWSVNKDNHLIHDGNNHKYRSRRLEEVLSTFKNIKFSIFDLVDSSLSENDHTNYLLNEFDVHFIIGDYFYPNDKGSETYKILKNSETLLKHCFKEESKSILIGINSGSLILAKLISPESIVNCRSYEIGMREIFKNPSERNLNFHLPVNHRQRIDSALLKMSGAEIMLRNGLTPVMSFSYGRNIVATQSSIDYSIIDLIKIIEDNKKLFQEQKVDIDKEMLNILEISQKRLIRSQKGNLLRFLDETLSEDSDWKIDKEFLLVQK